MQKPSPDSRQTQEIELMPRWAKLVLGLVAVLILLGYASPDMRAVYVAAWAACF